MRRLRSPIAFLAALLSASAAAQPSATPKTWEIVLSDARHRGEINDMEIAANGDIFVAGFLPAAGGTDAWIARYDGSGRQLWSQLVGGRYRDEAFDVALTDDGGAVIVGFSDNGATPRSITGLAARFTPDGMLLWQKFLTQEPELYLSQVEPLANGDVIVAGAHDMIHAPNRHPYLERLDKDGASEWQFDPDPHAPPADNVRSMSAPRTTINLRSDQVVEVQQLSGGQTLGEQPYGTCTTVDMATGKALAAPCDAKIPSSVKRAQNSVAFVGTTTGPYSATDPVIRKYEKSKLVWERVMTSPEIDGLNRVAPTADGGVVAAGFVINGDSIGLHNWDALLIKLDGDGHEMWRHKFGGGQRDEFTRVAVLPDGSIIAAGYTGSQGQYEWAPWLLRLNALGEFDPEARAILDGKQR